MAFSEGSEEDIYTRRGRHCAPPLSDDGAGRLGRFVSNVGVGCISVTLAIQMSVGFVKVPVSPFVLSILHPVTVFNISIHSLASPLSHCEVYADARLFGGP